MDGFIKSTLNAARNYTIFDFTCLKITLLSLGILAGAYFSDFFIAHVSVLWTIFIVSYIFIIYRTFFKYRRHDGKR